MSVIDFHSHVLNNIDDGSKSIEMSTEMLKASHEQGVNIQLATPHFYADRMHPESFLERREAAYDRIRPIAEDIGIDLRLGAEVAFFKGLRNWEEIDKFTIRGTNLLMIEMPFEQWTSDDISVIESIMDSGYRPIMAHLERFFSYQKDKGPIKEVLDLDLIIQFNCEFLLNFWTRGSVLKRIKNLDNIILGSDSHNITNRPQNIGEGRAVILNKLGQEYLDRIDNYGTEILKNS